MDITHDNVCSSMLSCFYSHLLSTGRPISSYVKKIYDIEELSRLHKLSRDIGWSCVCNVVDLDLSFDLAIVTLIFKMLSGQHLRNYMV